MRLGLIGTGKQGQRYLEERNGGRHITVSGSRRIPLDNVDGVIIATHPAGHKELALECIAAGKHVLIEKPLALNLDDCDEILDAAKARGVHCDVAHTHLWSEAWWEHRMCVPSLAYVEYVDHVRDYSPWLDWAPHLLALLAAANPTWGSRELSASVAVRRGERRRFVFTQQKDDQRLWAYLGRETRVGCETAMKHMVDSFIQQRGPLHNMGNGPIHFNRRVYRALFAEENHATR